MEIVHQNFISTVAFNARIAMDRYGELTQQNVLWSGSPNYDELITQEEIDTVERFHGAGLTTQHLADAVYALEQIRGILTNAMPALTVLAKLP